ncbi:hypothetical protein [Spiroplasma endosymbiont of Virgichneumon dumeticola]|uniref:hypothetical protein n=1 Tax=Spiroplasma endosymbiont of Virgichneumon dumeticola TaxID=3139323 RepID=UPI0035C8B114
MRKLLSLLIVLTLTVPVPLNVIACGGTSNPASDTNETDYLTLAQTAKEKIQIEFAKLVNDGLNLRREGDVTSGSAIMTYLDSIGQKVDKDITKTDSKETIDGFLEVLKTQVLKISNDLVNEYPELKPLFNGINPNDILKINTNDLDTILTNKKFEWKTSDFGLKDFDVEKQYGVTDWYHLTANLQLDFTCLDENEKINTTPINKTYDMYFANDGSDLNKVVTAVTVGIEEKLKVIKFVNLDYPQWNDSFVNQKNDVLQKINVDL